MRSRIAASTVRGRRHLSRNRAELLCSSHAPPDVRPSATLASVSPRIEPAAAGTRALDPPLRPRAPTRSQGRRVTSGTVHHDVSGVGGSELGARHAPTRRVMLFLSRPRTRDRGRLVYVLTGCGELLLCPLRRVHPAGSLIGTQSGCGNRSTKPVRLQTERRPTKSDVSDTLAAETTASGARWRPPGPPVRRSQGRISSLQSGARAAILCGGGRAVLGWSRPPDRPGPVRGRAESRSAQ